MDSLNACGFTKQYPALDNSGFRSNIEILNQIHIQYENDETNENQKQKKQKREKNVDQTLAPPPVIKTLNIELQA